MPCATGTANGCDYGARRIRGGRATDAPSQAQNSAAFPSGTRPSLREGGSGSLPVANIAATGGVLPVRWRHGTPCRVRPLRPLEETECTAARKFLIPARHQNMRFSTQ